MAHGVCLLWNWQLLFSHVSSDAVIACSYFAIPLILMRARRHMVNALGRSMLLSFTLFILLCGCTHVMDIVVIWRPWYVLQALVKAATAVVSIAAASQLARLALAFRNDLES